MRVDPRSRNDETQLSWLAGASTRHSPQRQTQHRGGQCIAVALAIMTFVATSVFKASPAAADFDRLLRNAVMQARGSASCGSLRPQPVADQTAAFAAQSTQTYLNHTARAVPIADPLPILKDLGSNAGKAKLLQGAGKTEADAIKFILVLGRVDIPNCSYAEYGVSALPNNNLGGYFLTALVLAGT